MLQEEPIEELYSLYLVLFFFLFLLTRDEHASRKNGPESVIIRLETSKMLC